MDPFKPSNNKPGSGAWFKEVLTGWVRFMVNGAKEILARARGRR